LQLSAFVVNGPRLRKNVRKDNPTPAYSPVSDRRRLTALAEVIWARRVQAPMPQISGPNLQENHIIERCKEEGCAFYFSFIFFAGDRIWNLNKVHLLRLLELSKLKKFRGRESVVYYFYVEKGIRQIDQHRGSLRRQFNLVMVEVLRVWNCFTV
jgi:hypothetical protein